MCRNMNLEGIWDYVHLAEIIVGGPPPPGAHVHPNHEFLARFIVLYMHFLLGREPYTRKWLVTPIARVIPLHTRANLAVSVTTVIHRFTAG